MLLDSSALVSIILDEEDASKLTKAIAKVDRVYVTPVVIYESTMAVARSSVMSIEQATEIVRQFCKTLNAQTVVIDGDMAVEALSAAARFGKGRHKASLNMGDFFLMLRQRPSICLYCSKETTSVIRMLLSSAWSRAGTITPPASTPKLPPPNPQSPFQRI